jgi:hypothetical protein
MVFFDARDRVWSVHQVEGVSVGMSSSEVRALRGEPAEVREIRSSTFLHYSSPGGSGRFRQRSIGLDEGDVVVDVFSSESWE